MAEPSRREQIRRIVRNHPHGYWDNLWEWASGAKGAREKWKRFRELKKWARANREFHEARIYARQARKYRRIHEEHEEDQQQGGGGGGTPDLSPGAPGWAGSRGVTDEIIRIVAGRAPVTSRKRTDTLGNPSSDHYVGNTTADAVDFGTATNYALRNEVMRRLGVTASIVDYGSYYIYRYGRRYRVQPIASTHGTGPHLHFGVRLA